MMGVNNSNGGIVGRRQQQQQHSSSAAPPAASSVVIDPNASESFVSLQQSSDSPAPASASSPAAGCVFVQVGDGSNPNVSLLLWGEDDNDKSERATHRHHNKKRKSGLPELLTPRYRIAHELALLQHHRQTKELTSWIYLLLHNAAFHPKVGGSAGSGSVGDFLDAALAFASALCPKARRQAGEAASSLSFLGAPSHSSTANNNNAASVSPFLLVEHSVLPVEARAMLGAGLAIALAWARIRGAASDDRELLFFTRHFHGLAQNVDAAVDELYRRCAGGSMTEWLASGLLNTWPAVCRFLGVCDLAPDGGISEFLAGRVPRAGLGPRFELLSCWCEH